MRFLAARLNYIYSRLRDIHSNPDNGPRMKRPDVSFVYYLSHWLNRYGIDYYVVKQTLPGGSEHWCIQILPENLWIGKVNIPIPPYSDEIFVWSPAEIYTNLKPNISCSESEVVHIRKAIDSIFEVPCLDDYYDSIGTAFSD